jgi:hypothetical protein
LTDLQHSKGCQFGSGIQIRSVFVKRQGYAEQNISHSKCVAGAGHHGIGGLFTSRPAVAGLLAIASATDASRVVVPSMAIVALAMPFCFMAGHCPYRGPGTVRSNRNLRSLQ